MKRWLKVVWICIAVTFAAGLLICGVAFAAGARGGLYLDETGLHTASDRPASAPVSEHDLAPFTNIDISLVATELHFVQADSFGYEVNPGAHDNIEVSLKDDCLSIREDVEWRFRFFSFDLFGSNWQPHDVTVYLPRGTSLQSLSVKTVSGSTDLAVEDLSVADFNYEAVSGNLNAHGKGLRTEELDLKAVSGNVDFAGAATTRISIDMVSGDTNLDLKGKADDYRFSLDKVSGSLRVNGQWFKDDDDLPGHWSSGDSSAAGRIDIHLISGDVEIRFEE
ncbi:MAG: DUF4097 domain-containing protein [Coriobacteriales bacterium]|jgi:hypothetical protein|nr:DUF4097 domain-containing protein [Coriobacteriales bacterium]